MSEPTPIKLQQYDLLLSDESILRVHMNIRDSLAYEAAARGHSWGAPQENAMRMQAIRAWSAARRLHPDVMEPIGWKQFVEATDEAKLHLIEIVPIRHEEPAEDLDDESTGALGESGRVDQSTD
ncbi:MAG: hypothetical protein ACTHYT_09940 [Agrococcus casei]|uniref:hypothetical protein n=1 Tax=Agrococcus casei TaxID=343512 RepID=UPI003F91B359